MSWRRYVLVLWTLLLIPIVGTTQAKPPTPPGKVQVKPAPRSPSSLAVSCTATSNPRVTSPFRVTFCVPNTDLDGGAVVALSNCRVLVDNVAAWSGVPTAAGPADPAGMLPFETPTTNPITAAKGNHTLTMACTPQNGEESDLSSPFAFAVVGGKGRPAVIMNVVK